MLAGSHRIGYAVGLGDRLPSRFKPGVLELQDTFWASPKRAVLSRWRQRLGSGIEVSCRASQLITHDADSPSHQRLPPKLRCEPRQCGGFRWTPVVEQAWARLVESAAELGACGIVYETPASFTPTAQNADQLRTFFSNVERSPDVLHIWEPAGLWTPLQVGALAQELNLLVAHDPLALGWEQLSDLHGSVGYFKLRAARYTDAELAQLAALIEATERCWAVFAAPGAEREARRLQALLEPEQLGDVS